jgi:hypothetical protein
MGRTFFWDQIAVPLKALPAFGATTGGFHKNNFRKAGGQARKNRKQPD